jgi:hypothetical protein
VSAFLSARGAPPRSVYAFRAAAFGLSGRLRRPALMSDGDFRPAHSRLAQVRVRREALSRRVRVIAPGHPNLRGHGELDPRSFSRLREGFYPTAVRQHEALCNREPQA